MNFILQFLMVMSFMILADMAWTIYFIKVEEKKPIASGIWSSIIIALGAFTIKEYTSDWRLIIAAVIGAFIGTAATVWWKKRKDNKNKK